MPARGTMRPLQEYQNLSSGCSEMEGIIAARPRTPEHTAGIIHSNASGKFRVGGCKFDRKGEGRRALFRKDYRYYQRNNADVP